MIIGDIIQLDCKNRIALNFQIWLFFDEKITSQPSCKFSFASYGNLVRLVEVKKKVNVSFRTKDITV